MTDKELIISIEESKTAVLRFIQKNLPADLFLFVEDVLQETYLRYYLNFRDKPPLTGDSLSRFLYVVSRNECRRTWRDNRKVGGLPYAGDANFSMIESHHSFDNESVVNRQEEEQWIREQVNELPEPFRQTTIFRMAGHKLHVIADKLGVSTGTIKSRLSRGREMLAKLMNKNKKEQGLDL